MSGTFDLWIICYGKGKRKKHGGQYFEDVIHKVKTSLFYIYQDYRKRFSIETTSGAKIFVESERIIKTLPLVSYLLADPFF